MVMLGGLTLASCIDKNDYSTRISFTAASAGDGDLNTVVGHPAAAEGITLISSNTVTCPAGQVSY